MTPRPLSSGKQLDACDRCGGVFIDYFDGEPAGLSKQLLREYGPTTDGQAQPPYACPDCQTPMEARKYLDDGPFVFRCGGCLALFVDAYTLGSLAHYRKTDPRYVRENFLTRMLDFLAMSEKT